MTGSSLRDDTVGPGWRSSRSPRWRRSTWPHSAVPQQLHLDFTVSDDSTISVVQHDRALSLGASILEDRFDDPDEPLYVFADPSGHPFCIFVAPATPTSVSPAAAARSSPVDRSCGWR